MSVESIIICKHGNLGYSASLRFKDKTKNVDISHNNKNKLYGMINFLVKQNGQGMEKVTVYSKERCVQCAATERALGKYGIKYEVVMLEEHPEELDRLISEGYTAAPIVETENGTWSGYRPDRIKNIDNS